MLLRGLIVTYMLDVWVEIWQAKLIFSGLAAKSVDLDVYEDVNVAQSNVSVLYSVGKQNIIQKYISQAILMYVPWQIGAIMYLFLKGVK